MKRIVSDSSKISFKQMTDKIGEIPKRKENVYSSLRHKPQKLFCPILCTPCR